MMILHKETKIRLKTEIATSDVKSYLHLICQHSHWWMNVVIVECVWYDIQSRVCLRLDSRSLPQTTFEDMYIPLLS